MKYIKISLKIIVSLLFVYIIYKVINVENVPMNRISLSISLVLQIIGVLILSILLRAYRWKYLANLNTKSGIKIGLVLSLKYLLIGSTLNIILPSGAGDVAKGYFAGQEQGDASRMYNASIYDKLIAIASLFFISIYGFVHTENYWVLFAGILSFTPLLFMISSKYILNAQFMVKLLDGTKYSLLNKLASFLRRGFNIGLKEFVWASLISILAWLCTYYLLFLCFQALELLIPLEIVITNSPMITLGRLFPFTLSGIGSDEALIIYLFKTVSSKAELILAGALFYRILLIIIPGVIGIPLVLMFKKRNHG